MTAELTENEVQQILDFKHDLHMYPELSKQEFRTTQKIREALGMLPGMELLEMDVPTGVLARLEGSEPDAPETLLRADIDALPQTELFESPWRSQNEGVMHACGHDFHTAALLGAAMILSHAWQEGSLAGTVDFLFQPAEEGTTGARAMIKAGLFEKIHPARCFGMHNWPSVPSGQVAVHEGPLMAAKRNFTIHLFGSGGHGSMPHLNTDPVVCAAAVISALQTIVSRNTSPLDSAVLSINYIEGGSPANLVVEEVEMRGTIRALKEPVLHRAAGRVKTIVSQTAAAFECTSSIDWQEEIPAVVNHEAMCAMARTAVKRAGGIVTDAPPALASEDFALYGQYVPSLFYWVGSTRPGDPVEELHRPHFHTDDGVLPLAASLYACSALL